MWAATSASSETKETYYDSLEAAGRGWHHDEHDIGGRGSKVAAIHQFVRSNISDEFTIDEVRQAVPGASDSYLSKVLANMPTEGILASRPAGRGSRWRRRRPDF
jgi:hypothetical protein